MTDTPAERGAESIWTSLRRRKVVQWGLAYAAGAWVLLQVLGFATDTYGWPTVIAQLAMLGLTLGLPIVVTLAWYHGDRGQQRITGSELAVLTLLLFLSGGVLWLYAQRSIPTTTTDVAVKPASPAAATDARPSIAVLPFENRSKLEDDVYFVDGIHDDILTQLTKVGALKVIARTSVEQFRDTKLTTKEIGEKLGVTKVLEGGVQRAGDRVRINVQLIDAGSDAHLWAESYDRELTAANIFAIQSEIAAAIANALKATLTVSEQSRLAKIPTRDLEAWQDYQLGRRLFEQRNSAALAEAEARFLKAIERDSEFALAYVGLAETLRVQFAFSAVAPKETLARAEQAVQKALALDPDLGSAHSVSAALAGLRYDFERAESEFKRAIGLDRSYATAHFWYSDLLAILGRYTEALREAESAVELDPLSSRLQSYYAQILGHVGRFDEAMVRLDRAIEIDPSVALSYYVRAQILSYGLNRWTDSLSWLRRSYTLDPGNVLVSTDLAQLYAELGDDQRFADWLEHARPGLTGTPYLAGADALFHAYRGEQTEAAAAAERVVALRPRNAVALRLLRDAELRAGRPDRSRARYQSALPELFESPLPPLNRTNYEAAIDVALVLRSIGDDARAAQLLAGSLDYLQGLVRIGMAGYGFADVRILALQGRRAEALNALGQAERAGWRAGWRYARGYDPALDSIRADPEFKAVFADIERDMAQQRARLAARPKDAPLELTEASR